MLSEQNVGSAPIPFNICCTFLVPVGNWLAIASSSFRLMVLQICDIVFRWYPALWIVFRFKRSTNAAVSALSGLYIGSSVCASVHGLCIGSLVFMVYYSMDYSSVFLNNAHHAFEDCITSTLTTDVVFCPRLSGRQARGEQRRMSWWGRVTCRP